MDKFLKRPATTDIASEATVKAKYQRRYDDSYLSFGFVDNNGQPQCVICLQSLANDSMKPVKLKRHLSSRHPQFENNDVDFFRKKASQLKESKEKMTKLTDVTGTGMSALKASYLVSERIAKCCKPHTIAESLILPAAVDMCREMLGVDAASKIQRISLSNNTVKRRIQDISEDINEQLMSRLRSCKKFSLQIDESTDISSQANLLVYVRYAWESDIHEDLLFCKPLALNCTGRDIFDKVNEFMEIEKLSWEWCIAISTDGAAAMTGIKSGFIARAKQMNQDLIGIHCMVHREALVAKRLDDNLRSVLDTAVKSVNFIKSRPLLSRLFAQLCESMESDHQQLLYHTDVRWLSRGKVLSRLFELRKEVGSFLEAQNMPLAMHFKDPLWIAQLAYLADIYDHLNKLSLSLQGKGANILDSSDKVRAFIMKIDIWKACVTKTEFSMFSRLKLTINSSTVSATSIQSVVLNHLESLLSYFQRYFGDLNTHQHDYIRNPFAPDVHKTCSLTGDALMSLIEISADGSRRLSFQEQSLTKFWISVAGDHRCLYEEVSKVILPFPSTYLCEAGFSALTALKTKNRSRLQVEDDLRVKLTTITARIEKLCKERFKAS